MYTDRTYAVFRGPFLVFAFLITVTSSGCDETPLTPEPVEFCGNLQDDDDDGLVDCEDPDCPGCREMCTDGIDNDGNGLTDCADPDCGGRCPENCADGIDNDGDGDLDCADLECVGSCPEVCNDLLDNDGDLLHDCADSDCDGQCPEVCADGRDNDADGDTDCDDTDCDGQCPEVCTDDRDNDGDGAVDCADPSCMGLCPEVCDDGWDNDGDGGTDCDDIDCDLICDVDGDGFVAVWLGGDDCDDDDDQIHPAMVEVCNEIDDDCDGQIDDADPDRDLGSAPRWYADVDLDGYGDPATSVPWCVAPPGMLANAEDCDDDAYEINPGAVEVCNEVDDDCDGTRDDDDPSTDPASMASWYFDQDGDGWGAVGADEVLACLPPIRHVDNDDDCDDDDHELGPETDWLIDGDGDGYGTGTPAGLPGCTPPSELHVPETRGEDCDDTEPGIHPGAVEACEDGIDQNCSGVDEGCHPPLRGPMTLHASLGKMFGEQANDHAGWSVAGAGDLDADGYADVILGAHDSSQTASEAGAAYVVRGPVFGPMGLVDADAVLFGVSSGDEAGYSVSGAGDVDADGFDDLIIGAPYEDSGALAAGAAYLVSGPVFGVYDLASADAFLMGKSGSDWAGFSVAGAGDVNGDGFADVVVGAYGEDTGASTAGIAYLVSGPASGLVDLSSTEAQLVGEESTNYLGYSVSSAGDVNGDGMDDLIVGGPYNDQGGTYAGAAYVVHGPVSGMRSLGAADGKFFGEGSYNYAGWSVACAGDVDGDGMDDMLVGAYEDNLGGSDAGAAYVIMRRVGGVMDLAAASAKLVGELAGDNAGTSVAGAGDVNDDGFADVLVGAPYHDASASAAGAAYLKFGPFTGSVDLEDVSVKLIGENASDYAGRSVAGAGDVDADGFDDIVVGAYGMDQSGSAAGVAYLVYGGAL